MARLEDMRSLGNVGERGRQSAATSFLWSTYRWMAVGLALTGLVAALVASSPGLAQAVLGTPLFWGLIIAELVLVVAFSAKAATVSPGTAAAMFLGYAALNGVTFAFIFFAYTQASIATAFFVTAGAFAGLSIYGSTTKRDLSAMGQFMVMGLIGFIIASVVNLFLRSEAIYWISTYAGVLIFAGLTAYDTQRLRALYAHQGEAGNLALRGALILYLDFINLFLLLLRIFGGRRN